MMTPEQQRIAIAEVCGWRWVLADKRQGYPHYNHWMPPAGYVQPDEEARNGAMFHPPDYLSDLNAMHVAEKVLRKDQFHYVAYWRHLFHVVTGKDWAGDIGYFHFEMAHATSTQRAEAFLRTLNLWTP